jgi:hypothetical protein
MYCAKKQSRYTPRRRLGERRYSSYSFTTSALEGGEWSQSRPSRDLLPGKGSPVPIAQEAGWATEPVWTQRLKEKFFRLCRGSNLDRAVVQPVVRHYTAPPPRAMGWQITTLKQRKLATGFSKIDFFRNETFVALIINKYMVINNVTEEIMYRKKIKWNVCMYVSMYACVYIRMYVCTYYALRRVDEASW